MLGPVSPFAGQAPKMASCTVARHFFRKGDLPGHFFRLFGEPKWLQNAFQNGFRKRAGAKHVKTRNRTTFQCFFMFLRSRLGPKWLQNSQKCMPKALQKRPPKNHQEIITEVPPKYHPKRPKAVTTSGRTHFLDPSGLKLGLQMGPKGGPAFLEKCRATLRSGRRNARSD